MPTEQVFVGLGSNLGDSTTLVEEAIDALAGIRDTTLRGRSSLYRSEPLGDIPQDDYINAVACLDCGLEPTALLLELQSIEHAFYRRREQEQRWGPRTLDLDIILFGNRRINDSHLTVPHREFANRRFVLEPLLEIDGDRFIPGYGSLTYLIRNAPPMQLEKLPRD
jgi:2-amino-4-hydroxy-6-hydroxymethyldihydropteridine diphosphokinase